MRYLKIFLWILLTLIILAGGAIALFIYTFDLNRYKSLAEEKLSSALNRPVTIESMDMKLSLVPTVNIHGFKILNNEPFKEKAPLLLIQNMEAELALTPLLNGTVNIHRVNISSADVNLLKDATQNNWSIQKPDAEKPAPEKATIEANAEKTATKEPQKKQVAFDEKNFHLQLVSIQQLNLNYTEKEKTENLVIKNFQMKQFHIISGDITYQNKTFTISLNTNNLFDFLKKAPNIVVNLKVQSSLLNLTLNGSVRDLNTFSGLKGIFNARAANMKNLLSFLQITDKRIPNRNASVKFQFEGDLEHVKLSQIEFNVNNEKDFILSAEGDLKPTQKKLSLDFNAALLEGNVATQLGLLPMTIGGNIQATPSSFQTNNLKIDANRSDIQLAVEAEKKASKYAIRATVQSNFLDIADFIREDKSETSRTKTLNKTTAKSRRKQKTLLPWKTLKAADVDLKLSVNHFKVSDQLSGYIGVTFTTTLHDGKLNAPFEFTLLDGKASGVLTANTNKKEVALKASANHLNLNAVRPLQSYLKDFVLYAKTSLTGAGASMDDLLQNLNGQILLQSNQGEIIHKQFVSLPQLLNFSKKKQTSVYGYGDDRVMIDCAAANIQIKKGILSGDNQVALETSVLNLLVGGTVNLPQQTMDIFIKPALSNSDTVDNLLSMTQSIRIVGPFNQLKPSVDAKQAAQNLLQAGANKLMKTPVNTSFCQQVLAGQSLITTSQKAAQPAQKTQAPTSITSQPQNNKKQFKEELLNSLFQVLTPQ